MAKLRLKIDGAIYSGWTAVRVNCSMQRLSGSFSLQLSQIYAGNPRAVRPRAGMACQVLIDDQPIITGYIDSAPADYDAENHTVTVSGRDTTADLVDCSAPPTQFRGQTLLSLCSLLCKPYGIEVVDQAGEGAAFRSDYKSNDGDSIAEVIEIATRARAVVATTDGLGRLVLARTGKARAVDSLELGRNILSGSGGLDLKDIFSRYTMKSQTSAHAANDTESAGQATGTASEPLMRRHRPIRLVADAPLTPKECGDRARWERDIRRGRANAVTYRVRGWLQSDGTPWRSNLLVTVTDAYQGWERMERLITDVAYGLDDKGEVVDITTMEPQSFALIRGPEPEEKAK